MEGGDSSSLCGDGNTWKLEHWRRWQLFPLLSLVCSEYCKSCANSAESNESGWLASKGIASRCAEVQAPVCPQPLSVPLSLQADWRDHKAGGICTSCRISQSISYSHLVLCIVITLISKSVVSKSVIRRFCYKLIKILDLIMDPGSAVLALKRKNEMRDDIQLKGEKFYVTKLHVKVCVLYAHNSSWSSFRKQTARPQ